MLLDHLGVLNLDLPRENILKKWSFSVREIFLNLVFFRIQTYEFMHYHCYSLKTTFVLERIWCAYVPKRPPKHNTVQLKRTLVNYSNLKVCRFFWHWRVKYVIYREYYATGLW